MDPITTQGTTATAVSTPSPEATPAPAPTPGQAGYNPFRTDESDTKAGATATPAAPVEATPTPTPTPAPAEPTTVPATVPVAAPAAPALTQEAIIELAAKAAASVVPSGQPAAQDTPLTQTELAEKFNFVYPTPEQLEAVFKGGPEGVAALTNLLHSTARMATTIGAQYAQKLVKDLRAELGNEMAPMRASAEATSLATHQKAFFTEYSGLADKKYEPLLVRLYDNLQAKGFKGTAQEVYARIATEAEAVLKSVDPTFSLKTPASAAAPNGATPPGAAAPATPTHRMSTLPSGGSGGQGARTASAPNTAQRIFG